MGVTAAGVLKGEVTLKCSDDVSRDYWVNSFYFKNASGHGTTFTGTEYTNLATALSELYAGTLTGHTSVNGWSSFSNDVKIFDLADPSSVNTPRQPKAEVQFAPDSGVANIRSNMGAAQVAIVLSFSGGGNVVGHRGRVFLGEWKPSQVTGPYVPSTLQNVALWLGEAIYGIGGTVVNHVIFHPKATKSGFSAGSTTAVDTYHVSNEWATVRRRALRATSKVTNSPTS
jgi:hypothetical protein